MIIDVIFAVVALYGFWVGYSRGIIKTVLTTASFLIGFMAAAKFSPTVSTMLQDWTDGPGSLMLPAAFVLTFILTLAIFRLLANALEGMLEAVNINFINQVMGGLIGMFFFVFLYSVLVRFADNSRMIEEQTQRESMSYEIMKPIPDAAWSAGRKIWPVFQEFYQHALDVMDQIDNSVERNQNDRFFDVEEDEEERPRRY